jgi:hypothetical protein
MPHPRRDVKVQIKAIHIPKIGALGSIPVTAITYKALLANTLKLTLTQNRLSTSPRAWGDQDTSLISQKNSLQIGIVPIIM